MFSLAEKQIISLYDAGVLSPAVLHHLLATYSESGIDWSESASLQTVDGHSVQEAVVAITMPGRPLRSAQKDFMSIVEHLAGKNQSTPRSKSEDSEENEDDDDLIHQLGGGQSTGRRTSSADTSPKRKGAGFNPLVGARAVSKK